jgi:squalene-associated FAD-dependent desaturase
VRQVLVIGGGLAGISAAIRLREAGAAVTLLESRPRLGGATSSFSRGELTIDNGQHVFLRCCTAYRDLLARLGVAGSVSLQERFDVTVLTPGRQARLRRSNLPAPLHLTSALARYRLLSPAERLAVGRAVLALRFADPASARLDGQRLGDWLGARWQNEQARRKLWDLFIISTLNVAGDEASTALAAKVIKTALLESNDAADVGIASIPLGELHGQAAGRLLDRLGAEVRLGVKAVSIEPAGGSFRVATEAAGDAAGALTADAVVLAVPSYVAAKLAPAGLPDAPQWAELGISPIVNVHVRYDRRVTRLPFAAALDSPVQWVFDKTRSAGVPTGQYLAVSLSAADEFVDVPAARLREQFLPALEQLFPAAAGASVLDFFVTRERRATFRQVPGTGRLRPGAGTVLPGLALAGAWTDTGWPDTMEGAVRSGQNAAEHIISELSARAPGDQIRAEWVTGGEIAAGASS